MSDAYRIPIKPLGIGEVALRVNDLRRSIAFYCETPRFTLVRVLHDSIAFIRWRMASKDTRKSSACSAGTGRRAETAKRGTGGTPGSRRFITSLSRFR